mgnify:CR=1 FL=1
MIKCTCCGGSKLQLYLESGGYSHYVCTECRRSISMPKGKEATAMQVTYNGFTGELVKLERIKCPPLNGAHIYDISIYDDENRCTHSFTGVKLEDVKFSGGEVSFK